MGKILSCAIYIFINMSSDYIETNSKTIEIELKKSNLLKKNLLYT